MLFTWFKFFSFFLVVKGVSNHFVTIYKMVENAFNFILMVLLYQILMAFIMNLLYNYYETTPYLNVLYSLRYVIDLLNGNYDRTTYIFGSEDNIESYLTIIHILISKIILVSLISALFMTTFQIMNLKGDFVCKSYRYEYIERYQLALKDEWGFSGLVTTPPPLNILLIFTIPCVFSPQIFQKASAVVAKIFFWLENIGLFIGLIFYSWFIIPIIYIKLVISLFKNLSFGFFILYLTPWLIIGIPYLNCLLFVDLFNLIRILSDSRDDDASQDIKDKEEELQDKAVLYNEVLEVIRALFKISREVQEEKRYVKVREIGSIYDPIENYNLEAEDGSGKFSFKIKKDLIMSSWIEYRPKTNRKTELSTLRKGRNAMALNSLSGESDHSQSKHETDKQEMASALFEEEKSIVNKFLNKFVANPEISQNKLIDISKVIKALPVKFNSKNVSKSEIINMRNMQLALIGFQNTSQDKLFNYYGTRMKTRILLLSQQEINNREIIQDIKKYSNSILSHVSRMNLRGSSKKKIPFPNVDSDSEEHK